MKCAAARTLQQVLVVGSWDTCYIIDLNVV